MKSSENYQIFHDIVNYQQIPPKISGFFESLKASTKNNSAPTVINTLNEILKENKLFSITTNTKGAKESLRLDLLTWYTLLRNIFIVRWRNQERKAESDPKKSPIFCTFDRTFEHPAFYASFWFQPETDKKSTKNFISSPIELLHAFERYMYDSDGAACWSALDLTVDKFIFRCIGEAAGKMTQYEDPRPKIASLILCAHKIMTGNLGLYISESQNVELKYAGVSNTDPTLLKYFHYDRHTRFSFTRERERDLKKDADATNPNAEFEIHWSALAAIVEFILQNKGARATKTTCSRVSIGTIIKCLTKLQTVSSIQVNQSAVQMLSLGIELLDSESFVTMTSEAVLAAINWSEKILPVDHCLKKYAICDADQFWQFVSRVFDAFIERFNKKHYKLLSQNTTNPKLKNVSKSANEDSALLLRCLLYEQTEELRGRLGGARLRNALKTLLINGELEFHSGQLWAILQKKFNWTPFIFFNPLERKRALVLPYQWFCSDILAKNISSELNIWARDILSNLTKDKDCAIVLNFSQVDFAAIQRASDKVWDIYFNPEYESAVKLRYIISLLEAKKIFAEQREKYSGIKLAVGKAREELLHYLDDELTGLAMGADLDITKLKEDFAKRNIYCFADFSPTWQRCFVILDLLARLVIAAAKNMTFAAIWENFDERLRFITHILSATHSNLNHPFPYHIGLQGDTVLRISRGTDQRDHLTRLANHEYENLAEQYCFLMALGKYLQQENEPQLVLQAIIDNASLAAFAAPDQLDHLQQKLAGEK